MRRPIGFVLVALAVLGCGEVDEAVDPTQSAIINGSTDFTSYPNEQLRTAKLKIAPGTMCSGTIMRTRVVLTAAHCVTTGNRPDGPLRPLSDFTVNGLNPIEILRPTQTNVDAALLFFGGDVTLRWEDFTAFDPSSPSRYSGSFGMVTGYGADENGQTGTLKRGFLNIYAPNTPYTLAALDNWAGIAVTASNPQGGTATAKGDSGGPLWGSIYYPSTVFGITSAGFNVAYGTTYFAQAHDVRAQFRRAIYQRVKPDLSVGFDSASDLDNNFGGIQGTTGTAANWTVSGSALVQTTNAPQSFLIQIGNRSFENVYVETYAQSSDDDTMGLVFRYVDVSNHYRCEVNRALRHVRLVKRFRGNDTVLASTTWTGKFDGGSLTAGATEQTHYCSYRDTVVEASDTTFPIGKVGLYNHYNKAGKFLSFASKQTRPQDFDW